MSVYQVTFFRKTCAPVKVDFQWLPIAPVTNQHPLDPIYDIPRPVYAMTPPISPAVNVTDEEDIFFTPTKKITPLPFLTELITSVEARGAENAKNDDIQLGQEMVDKLRRQGMDITK